MIIVLGVKCRNIDFIFKNFQDSDGPDEHSSFESVVSSDFEVVGFEGSHDVK